MTEAAQITKQGRLDILDAAEEIAIALEKLNVLLNDILEYTGTEPKDELDRACYIQHRADMNYRVWIAADYLGEADKQAANIMTLCKELKGIV